MAAPSEAKHYKLTDHAAPPPPTLPLHRPRGPLNTAVMPSGATTPDPASTHAPARFATTHWSVVLSAGRTPDDASRGALETLCARYWMPLYAYVRRHGHAPDDAQDLTQAFFAHLLEKNTIARADRTRGRFRSFLLASLRHFLADEADRARALKRGGGVRILPLEFETGEHAYVREPADNATPEQLYERRWALTLLDNVLARLRDEHARDGRAAQFDALGPCLTGTGAGQPYADLAARLGLTEAAVKSAVHRLRRRYRALLREEVAHTVAGSGDVDDELRHLLAVLARR